ncbi:MAG: M3 family oligoendopeptidase [Pirellulales bacterium]
MSTSPHHLPHWDLSNLYTGLTSDDYHQDFSRYESLLDKVEQHFTAHSIGRTGGAIAGDNNKLAGTLSETLDRLNELAMLGETLGAFVHGIHTTNSYDADAIRETSRLEILGTRRQQLEVRLKGWVGSLGERLELLIHAKPTLASHAFLLRLLAQQSRFLMSEEMERLAAELCLDAGVAFGRLQGNVTSQLKVPFERDGKTEHVPITVIRNLSYDPDSAVRERAYRTEIKGWESIRTTVAACLNGVKGTALTLAKQRGRKSVLDVALEDNRIDRPTLDALLGAIREYFPMFRRYLASKAKKLGKQTLPWWDIFAPLGKSDTRFTWTAARKFIIDKFSTFSSEMGEFAATAFDRRWIDAEPRDGKRGGAYCMPIPGREESRILANFDGSFEQVSTLAHELGHGFHNHCQRGLEMLRRGSPSTLAETASIFCETLVAEAAIRDAQPAEKLMILEAQLAGATQVCLDISSRYIFETAVLDERADSELSPEEFNKLMTDAQRQTYAEGVDEATYHPYMWLWKPHYYSHDYNFYNFPYAFGHLFGLGLYAVFQREGASFVPRYTELLRDTGQYWAAPLAGRFGIDITKPNFWRDSLRVIERQVNEYEQLNP